MTEKRKRSGTEAQKPRRLARVAAVQALYQMDVTGADAADVIAEFSTHRFTAGAPAEDEDGVDNLTGTDATFFSDILRGVVRRQREIDPLVDHQLATGWRLVRVDSILRAILRAGTYELMERSDVPARVAINEYINVAHAFFSEEEPKVVNGILDRLARRFRETEMKPEEA